MAAPVGRQLPQRCLELLWVVVHWIEQLRDCFWRDLDHMCNSPYSEPMVFSNIRAVSAKAKLRAEGRAG